MNENNNTQNSGGLNSNNMEEIKAWDIMIGSIVTVDNPKHHPHLKNVPMRVKEIFVNGDYAVKIERVTQTDDPNTCYSQFLKFIRPIPLTEDVLLKAGFEKYRKGYSLNVGGESFDYYIKDKFVIWDHKHKGYNLEPIASQGYVFYNYLHELQNLVRCLTKTELIVEL